MLWRGRVDRRFSRRFALALGLAGVAAACVGALTAGGEGAPKTSAHRVEAGEARRTRALEIAAPVISGTARVGQRLTASPGSWSEAPTSYRYEWKRCNTKGRGCKTIRHASGSRYTLAHADLRRTVRVAVTALNAAGRSKPALSAPTRVIGGPQSGAVPLVRHLEYVFNDGPVTVYDIDNGFKLVESFTLPGTNRGVRGVAVSPATHVMFVSYGGDGGGNGSGSVLAYDLVAKKILWSVNLHTGIDSGAVSADGKRLYMPDGENSSDGDWNILDTSNGNVIGKITTPGTGPHDGVMSADGKLLLLGDRDYSHLLVYNTQTGKLQAQVGSLMGGVRPLTINGSDSVVFTTATGFDGFQVESTASPSLPLLYTESFGNCSGPFSTCSHGVSLSPDNRQLDVIDTVHKAVQVWDVHGVAGGVAPVHLATVPVDGLQGNEEGCAYDCGRDGWLHHTIDGRYVLVGDSGDVIETATERVVAKIPDLLNTRKFVEIAWSGGVPVASSGRQGVGYTH